MATLPPKLIDVFFGYRIANIEIFLQGFFSHFAPGFPTLTLDQVLQIDEIDLVLLHGSCELRDMAVMGEENNLPLRTGRRQ